MRYPYPYPSAHHPLPNQVMRYPVPLASMAGLVRSYLLHFTHEQAQHI
jgi:hypothetical protein